MYLHYREIAPFAGSLWRAAAITKRAVPLFVTPENVGVRAMCTIGGERFDGEVLKL
jgi:hypothetical protein